MFDLVYDLWKKDVNSVLTDRFTECFDICGEELDITAMPSNTPTIPKYICGE